jgi:hypothetical protein
LLAGCGAVPTSLDDEQAGTTAQALVIPNPPAPGCPSQVLVDSQQQPLGKLFVDPNGNDASAGTIGAPLATLAGAHAKIVAASNCGDLTNDWLINVRGGTYFGQHVNWTKTSVNHRIHIQA